MSNTNTNTSSSNDKNSSRTLTHIEFYKLTELVKIHKDGVALCSCYREARDFLQKKLKEMKETFSISEHSVSSVLHLLGVELKGKKKQSGRRPVENIQHSIDILTRAIGRIYEQLGMEKTQGLIRLLDIARRESSFADLKSRGEDITQFHE